MTLGLSDAAKRAAERQSARAQEQHRRIQQLETALAEIEAKAPTCLPETEAMTAADWRSLCRDMQSIARLARKGIDRKGRAVTGDDT